MDLEKDKWDAVNDAIGRWERDGKLSHQQAMELRKTIGLKQQNVRQQLARYFFLVAISCTILAFSAIFIDEKLLEKIRSYFALSNYAISVFCILSGSGWFWYVQKHRRNYSQLLFELYCVLGALLLLTALVYICKETGFGPSHSGFLLAAFGLLFTLATLFRSNVLWAGTVLAIMGWYGAFSTWLSKDNLFLGMNYPLRFALFGVIVIGLSLLQLKVKKLFFAQRITYLSGLIIFFTGMWGVSIFGNFGHLEDWAKVRQTYVLVYSIVFGLSAIAAFYLGIRYKDETTRDIGILFLLLNLYTRYFEFFWDAMNKGLFFLILAVSFWLIGRRVERRKTLSGRNDETLS